MIQKSRNAISELIFSGFILFFIWTPIDAQNGTPPCGSISHSCLNENSTTDYDEKINSAILNKITQRYSIRTHKLILCTSVSEFKAIIDEKGERYILCPSATALDKLIEGNNWRIIGDFLHAIAHLKSGNLANSSEIYTDIETANMLKLAGATYEQAILHLNDITTYSIRGVDNKTIVVPKTDRLKEFKKVFGINDIDLQREREKIARLKKEAEIARQKEEADSKNDNGVKPAPSKQKVEIINYEKNYLAIGLGAGTDFAGLGLVLQTRFGGERIGFGLHGNFGVIPELGIYYGGGMKFFFHKGGFIDFSYAKSLIYFYENNYDDRFVSAQVGWNFFFPNYPRKSRFGMSFAIGGTYNYEYYYPDLGYLLPTGQIGFIYRLTGGTQK